MRKAIWVGLIGLLWSGSLRAEVRLPRLFADHMVVQQGRAIPVWGWADNGEKVSVTFRGRTVTVVAQGGGWMVQLGKAPAGGPYELVVAGKNTITLRNVLVGEVWICSGQSNMEWPLSRTYEAEAAMAAANYPKLRLFRVERMKANEPISDVQGAWKECAPAAVKDFSAVAYYFGRDLHKALNVPVGLIETAWGGSPAEVWMSKDILEGNADFRKSILDAYPAAYQRYRENLAKWEAESERLKKEGREQKSPRPGIPWKPTELYNGMIAPLTPFAIQGAIWYQGESNAGRAFQYRTLFTEMIRNWRRDWRQGDFPFLLVQLAPWDKGKKRSMEEITSAPVESDWAELREAQFLSTRMLPRVGMAVITDVGDKDDIHPQKKEPVGGRLAVAAQAMVYGRKVEYSGPVFKSMQVQGSKAVIRFDHVGRGLEARGGKLSGFAVAGADNKFVWAEAEIQGAQVIVHSPQVAAPVSVRFGWADYPVVNLWNKDGLPAVPFRTDKLPMLTAPKP